MFNPFPDISRAALAKFLQIVLLVDLLQNLTGRWRPFENLRPLAILAGHRASRPEIVLCTDATPNHLQATHLLMQTPHAGDTMGKPAMLRLICGFMMIYDTKAEKNLQGTKAKGIHALYLQMSGVVNRVAIWF